MHNREEKIEALGRVIDTLDILRVKCPWDAKQTNESLRPNTNFGIEQHVEQHIAKFFPYVLVILLYKCIA